MRRQIETRTHRMQDVELRQTGDDTCEFRGYATVYNYVYPVAGGPEAGGWDEMVADGAGSRTLNAQPDVRLLFNHDGIPMARTRSGTLLLEEDKRGLLAIAPALDMRSPLVQQVRSAMDRGDVDEMSFAFRATRSEWNDDYTHRIIREYALDVVGSDVSIVTYPANPATVAQLRSAAGIAERPEVVERSMDAATARAMLDQIRLGAPA